MPLNFDVGIQPQEKYRLNFDFLKEDTSQKPSLFKTNILPKAMETAKETIMGTPFVGGYSPKQLFALKKFLIPEDRSPAFKWFALGMPEDLEGIKKAETSTWPDLFRETETYKTSRDYLLKKKTPLGLLPSTITETGINIVGDLTEWITDPAALLMTAVVGEGFKKIPEGLKILEKKAPGLHKILTTELSVNKEQLLKSYNILGIKPGSADTQVKTAYRDLALRNYPDRGGDPNIFRNIQNAYDTIQNARESIYSKLYYAYKQSKLSSEKGFARIRKEPTPPKKVPVRGVLKGEKGIVEPTAKGGGIGKEGKGIIPEKDLTPEVLDRLLLSEKDLIKRPPSLEKLGLRKKVPLIAMREDILLKQRIRSEARGAKFGYTVGHKIAREKIIQKFNEKNLTAEDARKSVEQYVREVLEPQDRGKFLVSVRDAKTPKQAARAFVRIDTYAEKQELKQAISNLKNTTNKLSESPAISADYRNKIKDIIEQYELSGHTEAILGKLLSTQEYLDRAKTAGEDVELPQKVLNKLKILSRIPKDELTLSQVQGLQNEIELMGKLGETKWTSKQALYDTEKETRTNALLGTATPINAKTLLQQPIGSNPREWAKRYIALRNYLQKSRIGLTPIEGLVDITGMGKMKADLDLNYGNYLTYNDVAIKQWYDLTKDFTDGQFERIGVIAISRQAGGMERLANVGITEKEINAIKLTPAEEKVYQFVRNTFEGEFPAVKKYALDVYNADVGQVDNYVSFMSDYSAMSDLEIYERFGQRVEEIAMRRTKTVEIGFTKERAQISKIKLELNIDKIFRRHVDDVAYMLTSGRDIKMYYEIVNSPEMRAKLGDMGTLAWLQYLDLMARKGGTEGAKRIAALDIIRKNMGAGVLGFRLSSALVQFTSFADTMATIGAEWATKGATNITTSKEWRNFIMDNFPEIKKAVGDDIAFREFGDGLFGKAAQLGFKPLQVLDGVMRSVAAAGSYQKLALEKGIIIDLANPNKQLVQEATRLMRQSQGSSFFKDQPLAITTGFGLTDNKSVNKAILTFQSFMLARWDNINRQIWRLGIKEKNYKKAASSFFFLVILAAAMEEGVRKGSRAIINTATGDIQKEQSFIKNSILNIVQTVPILGQFVSAITYSSNPVPVINTFEEILSGIGSFVKGKKIETRLRGLVRATGGIGSLAGIAGSSQAAQIIRKTIPITKKTAEFKLKSYEKSKSPGAYRLKF